MFRVGGTPASLVLAGAIALIAGCVNTTPPSARDAADDRGTGQGGGGGGDGKGGAGGSQEDASDRPSDVRSDVAEPETGGDGDGTGGDGGVDVVVPDKGDDVPVDAPVDADAALDSADVPADMPDLFDRPPDAPLRSLGDSCDSNPQCTSGHCVDGVCCESACDAACLACNDETFTGKCLPLKNVEDPGACSGSKICDDAGLCKSANGQPCGSYLACASGNCSEGTCCDVACGDPCWACDAKLTGVDSGICAPVVAGMDPRDDCAEAGPETCKYDGTCDGTGGCRLWPAGTLCAAGCCATAEPQTCTRVCDGAGVCLGAMKTTPCDDGNPCTADTCVVKGPLTVDCDHASSCADGACCCVDSAACAPLGECPGVCI